MLLRTAFLLGALLVAPLGTPSAAAFPSGSSSIVLERPDAPLPDSVTLIREAREAQRQFEEFRVSRIPPRTRTEAGRCDVRIGRLCHWFGGAQEADFPPELTETGIARRELVSQLQRIQEDMPDSWVLGQIIHYLIEEGRLAEARRTAAACGLAEPWWCQALEGYVLHLQGDFPGSEQAFQAAVDRMPDGEREEWTTPRYILTPDAERAFRRASETDRTRTRERLWRFSNPLFLVEGNDRFTDHDARQVLARIRRDAENPHLMAWEDDLEEALLRYGRTIGWSRTRGGGNLGMGLQDNRQVVAHHDPASRGYLFAEEFLEAPAEIPPEAWITAPREARTWYAAPYAPDFRGLETQVARFRRGDSLLVVGAYRPDPTSRIAGVPEPAQERGDPFGSWDPFGATPREAEPPAREETRAGTGNAGGAGDAAGGGNGRMEAGLFLVEEDGGGIHRVLGTEREGVLTLRAPTGRYVSSLELLDRAGGAAWRARQGVTQVELPRGLAGLSDLLILKEDAPLPATLEEALPLVRPGIRVRADERFAIAWEVYGLQVEEPARITIGFTQGRPGFLRRVGEFVGVVETDEPVEISFDETAPDDIQILFRALEMRLPALEPGEYTLHVRLELSGREPAITSRPILVEP
ncbi:MAG: hypothetical protein EA421_06105 [Gemmatimonadales bacterium]|nr:MAG: hypothetical protein EA421_06105 [Gemmatimonadales bacterium]